MQYLKHKKMAKKSYKRNNLKINTRAYNINIIKLLLKKS